MASSNKFRGDYEQLNQIAQTFSQETDAVRQMLQSIQQAKGTLENGDWVGKGADQFYGEMNTAVLPSLSRLVNALDNASRTTQKISRIVKKAEDDSAALFKLVGGGAAGQGGLDGMVAFGPGGSGGSGAGGSGSGTGGSGGSGAGGSGSGAGGSGGSGGSGSGSGSGGSGGTPVSATTRNSLTVTGDAQGFADMANSIIGVQYKVVVDSKGVVSLQKTDVQGPLTPAGQELVNTLQTIMNDPKPTKLEFVNNSPTVIVGQYSTGKIDLADIRQFGNGIGVGENSGGALVHEMTEQYRKQVHGEDYPTAHAAAFVAENRAVGATYGGDTIRQINSTTQEITTKWTYPGGKVVNVVWTLKNNNVTSVTRR